MTDDISQQIEEMSRTLAVLLEARRFNGNRGFDVPISRAIRRLDELRSAAKG